jgi:predicted dehydrogenase
MKSLNVGMIGGGFMGKAHSIAFAGMPMLFWPAPAIPVRKVIADASDELARDGQARYGFESSTSNWRDVVEDPAIDIVDIVTPNDLHLEMAVAAANAGKHILCEKPLARNGSEAKQMLEAVERAGVIHMVAFNYRRTPAVLLAKKFIEDGSVGDVLSYRCTYLQSWSADPVLPLTWRHVRSVAGSGTLGDIASHSIDMARFLIGEISTVNSVVQTHITERPGPQGWNLPREKWGEVVRVPVDVDDQVTALLRFENGVLGSLEATRNAWGRHNHITFEVHGSKGSLWFDYEHRDVLKAFFADDPVDRRGFRTIFTGPEHPYGEYLWPISALGIGYIETKLIECYDFVKAVVDNTLPSPNFRDGCRVAQICDAILESSESGDWVDIDSTVPA